MRDNLRGKTGNSAKVSSTLVPGSDVAATGDPGRQLLAQQAEQEMVRIELDRLAELGRSKS